jgi:hypothetical protein
MSANATKLAIALLRLGDRLNFPTTTMYTLAMSVEKKCQTLAPPLIRRYAPPSPRKRDEGEGERNLLTQEYQS